jgi:hypothetical protein
MLGSYVIRMWTHFDSLLVDVKWTLCKDSFWNPQSRALMTDRHQQKPYPLRMPEDLRQLLEEQAERGGRSLHAEIIGRLRASVTGKPNIRWAEGGAPSDLAARHGLSEAEINAIVEKLAERLRR